MRCLKGSVSHLNNTYTSALLAYVFSLAGDTKTRDSLLQHLDTVATGQGESERLNGGGRGETVAARPWLTRLDPCLGGSLHWSQSSEEKSPSLSVEISSYVLLAKLSGSPTAEDLGYASRIVRWLTGQQNYYGGFSSTQVPLGGGPFAPRDASKEADGAVVGRTRWWPFRLWRFTPRWCSRRPAPAR